MRRRCFIHFLLALLMALPFLAAEIPAEVENYCAGFNASECNAHASWFMIDSCRSMIKCVTNIDIDTFAFNGCRTILRNIFDDCEKYPSTLCYNNVAYDTSHSETCADGSARFRVVDSCGNPEDFGSCIRLETCEEVTVSPYTGTAIVVHENCDISDSQPAERVTIIPSPSAREDEEQETPAEEEASSSGDREDDTSQRRTRRQDRGEQEDTGITTNANLERATDGEESGEEQRERAEGEQAALNQTMRDSRTGKASIRDQHYGALWIMLIVLLLLVGIIVYWYWYYTNL